MFMKSRVINRRDFLKYLGGFLFAPILLRLRHPFDLTGKKKCSICPLKKVKHKDAKHYTRADHLAG